jgi:hypothetical protein
MYWSTQGKSISSIESYGLGNSGHSHGSLPEFYEIEPAIVTDIILDENHPFLKQMANVQTSIDVDRWPSDLQGNKPTLGEINYSWIGRALVRLIHTSPKTDKEKLIWAYPLDYSPSEFPLVNETVLVYLYRNKFYYSRRLNQWNFPNEAVDFAANPTISGNDNTELFGNNTFSGRISKTSAAGQPGFVGVAGKYLKLNDKIRAIKRYEGDMVIESRFGQTIRFGAYDDNRGNDQGDPKNPDYSDFGGNPMIIIRNRQRKLLKEGETVKLVHSPNPKPVVGTKMEKNAGGFVKENINHDGTTLAITSGQTISDWATTCYKKMFGVGEETGGFSGKSSFKYPVLNGDQAVLNTDRIILSSRNAETFHYSKKRYSVVTDSEYTVDAHDQMIFTTNQKVVINSPAIYLGEYDQTGEPVVLGQTLANWCYDLCNWIAKHTHWYHHSHTDAGKESPSSTQVPVEIQELFAIRDRINTWLSRRVFTTGGGFAPGQNGGSIPNGTAPVHINVGTGGGVPGGWKGANHR